MQEEGLVVESDGLIAKVAIKRGKDCRGCNLCISDRGEIMIITNVLNTIQAKAGDKVRLEIPSGNLLKAGFWVYILPLSGLILGLAIGDYLFHSEAGSFLSGLTGLALAFLLVHLYDKRIKTRKRSLFKIIEVIEE